MFYHGNDENRRDDSKRYEEELDSNEHDDEAEDLEDLEGLDKDNERCEL